MPSWFFGDGAGLLNAFLEPGFAQRLRPIDEILTSKPPGGRSGPALRVRLARRLSTRYAIEINLDAARARFGIADDVNADVLATRQSFEDAFAAILAAGPPLFDGSLSDATIRTSSDVNELPRRVSLSSAVNVSLRQRGALRPYVAAGAGFDARGRTGPVLNLGGRYQFTGANAGGSAPFDESDAVTVSYRGSRAFGVIGGGLTYERWSTRGFRVDLRVHVGGGVDTILDTTITRAVVELGSGQRVVGITSTTNPFIRFTNFLAPAGSTLGGPPLESVRTRIGGGHVAQVLISAGYYFRF